MLPKSHSSAPATRLTRPGDATLSVTKAARVLGVHPNTVRAWSDAGRLHYYRINERGDRRYRMTDLQRFLAAAASPPTTVDGPLGSRALRRTEAAPATLTETAAGVDLLADLAEIASFPIGLDTALEEACHRIRLATGAALVGIWERRPAGLVSRAVDAEGPGVTARRALPGGSNLFAEALDASEPIHVRPGIGGRGPLLGTGTDELVTRIPGGESAWGVLVIAGAVQLGPDDGRRLAQAIARTLGVLISGSSAAEQATGRLRRSEALRRVATDLASRLDVGDVVRDMGDHARVLFGADRVGVVLRDVDGRVSTPGASGFSEAFMATVRAHETARGTGLELPPRRPTLLLGPDAPRSTSAIRAAAIQEGVDTLLVAPLVDGRDLHGMLFLGHDRPHRWRPSDLESAQALAGDAAIAVRSARTFGRMAAWAAQLQSIQRLGARLSGLTGVREIGHAIATELRQLIDYQNVRVYRVQDEELVPVAILGEGAVYGDETIDSLKVAVGEGITGWVARFRVPQLVGDTANDPRAVTIPGSEPDLEESMLLAPMVHEGTCLGVLVLSSVGLNQFTEDDLRLLVIYASFAAQAMANADATERLRDQSKALQRQLLAQRELLRTTESILTALDQRSVLQQITSRLGALIQCDNMVIEVVDATTGRLVPLTARGVHAAEYLAPWEPGEAGITNWVLEHNEPALIPDERLDDRVNQFRPGVIAGSLIVVPLIGPQAAAGVLTLERLGTGLAFDEQDFELVKLFAGQVSIALRNAEIYQAAEVRARTDDLTGLLNHRTFKDQLAQAVTANEPFGLVMIDLDRFKAANDSLGHLAGDRLLREIAGAIESAARESDTVFRYGGDEFAVILSAPVEDRERRRSRTTDAGRQVPLDERLEHARQGLRGVADRILAAVDAVGAPGTPWHAEGVGVGVSIGIASYPVDGTSADDILLAADRACFVAKRGGRGRVATAAEGLALAREFTLSEPTPVDPPSTLASPATPGPDPDQAPQPR
jgi:excisionase family DNA binding protein